MSASLGFFGGGGASLPPSRRWNFRKFSSFRSRDRQSESSINPSKGQAPKSFELWIHRSKVRSALQKIRLPKVPNFRTFDLKIESFKVFGGFFLLRSPSAGAISSPIRFSQVRAMSSSPGFPGRRLLPPPSVSSGKGGISSSLASSEFPETLELSKV